MSYHRVRLRGGSLWDAFTVIGHPEITTFVDDWVSFYHASKDTGFRIVRL